jgi:phage gp29-like protein
MKMKINHGEIAHILHGNDITRGYVSPDFLLQAQDTVLQTLSGGNYEIYQEILRDPRVFSCLQQRFSAGISKDYIVEPATNSKKDKMCADFIREWVEGIQFDNVMTKMLYAIFYGFSVAEVMYSSDGNNVIIDEIKVKDRNRFRFDGQKRLRLITSAHSMGEIMPDRKFWVMSYGADHDDDPYGKGIAHQLYWPVFFKKIGDEGWASYLERYVNPPIIGEYPIGATEEQKTALEDAALSLNNDSVAIYPVGMILKYLESGRTSSADYDTFVGEMDSRITMIILSQTATTEGTAGALGEEKGRTDVKKEITVSDQDLFCMSFSKNPVKWLSNYNYPNANPPRVWRDMSEGEDLNSRADRESKLFAIGYKLSPNAVREIYGEDYEPFEPPQQGFGLNTDFKEGLADTEKPFKDSLAPLFETLDKELGDLLPKSLLPLSDFIKTAETLEEIRNGLFSLYGKINTDGVAETLSNAAMAAYLLGQSEVKDGE